MAEIALEGDKQVLGGGGGGGAGGGGSYHCLLVLITQWNAHLLRQSEARQPVV